MSVILLTIKFALTYCKSSLWIMNIHSGYVVSKDVLESFMNLLQSGDRTSPKN